MSAQDTTLHGEILGPVEQEHEEAVQNAERIAHLFDSQFKIAGVPFGLDSIIGLIPGVGDLVSGAVGVYFLKVADQIGLPKTKRAAMIGNLAVDTAVGMIPLAGDLFDVAFKAHRKNAAILRKHVEKKRTVRRTV